MAAANAIKRATKKNAPCTTTPNRIASPLSRATVRACKNGSNLISFTMPPFAFTVPPFLSRDNRRLALTGQKLRSKRARMGLSPTDRKNCAKSCRYSQSRWRSSAALTASEKMMWSSYAFGVSRCAIFAKQKPIPAECCGRDGCSLGCKKGVSHENKHLVECENPTGQADVVAERA